VYDGHWRLKRGAGWDCGYVACVNMDDVQGPMSSVITCLSNSQTLVPCRRLLFIKRGWRLAVALHVGQGDQN
jgi:hypothetical protein